METGGILTHQKGSLTEGMLEQQGTQAITIHILKGLVSWIYL